MSESPSKHNNPFDRIREPKRHDVAQMILSGKTISWDEILAVVGNFSPRTMGYVLRGLENQNATILRLRDNEHGTLYRYDPNCEYDERYRLSRPDGPDALRQEEEDAQKEEPES